MMTSSSAHNEMVTISLFDHTHNHKIDRSSDDESLHPSESTDYDSRHGLNNQTIFEYQPGKQNLLIRSIQRWMMERPNIFSVSTAFLLCSLPLLVILVIVLVLSKQYHSSSTSSTSTTSTSSDIWNTFQVTSSYGVVSTDHSTCSQIGVDILNLGGNAVDASIAAKLCLGVVSPASSGIGGGALILIHDAQEYENLYIDSRETAPSQAYSTMFESNPLAAQNGGLAIAVPGEMMGLYLAWERYGSETLTWSDLVYPAAKLAEEWVISMELAAYIQYSKEYILSGDYPELSNLYINSKTGQLKQQGDIVQQPELAQFLNKFAEQGPDIFYVDLADTIAAEIQAAGGIITADDIQNYQPMIYTDDDLIKTEFMGYQYVGVSGCSSGGPSVAGILNFMQSYPEALVSLGNLYYHRLAEAFKHVFAVRLSLGDPSYVNVTGAIDALISLDYMTDLQLHTLDDNVLPLNQYGGKYNLTRTIAEDHGTTHLSTIDRYGNAVAMTSTINTYFGSKVISPSTGIVFNNEMDDFSIPNSSNYFGLAPSPFNYPEPNKRPLSSMSPSFLFDKYGKLRLIGGASGGPIIITATAQIILNYIAKGMSLLHAITSPRIHSQLLPNVVLYENNSNLLSPDLIGIRISVDQGVVNELIAVHHLLNSTNSVGITQFITVDPDTGLYTAVSDPRKGGIPAGQ